MYGVMVSKIDGILYDLVKNKPTISYNHSLNQIQQVATHHSEIEE